MIPPQTSPCNWKAIHEVIKVHFSHVWGAAEGKDYYKIVDLKKSLFKLVCGTICVFVSRLFFQEDFSSFYKGQYVSSQYMQKHPKSVDWENVRY